MGVHAKVFGFCCIDPRFRNAFEQFLESKFGLLPTEYEIKTDAGASREIALKTSAGEWLLKNAEIAYQKHGVRTFIFCNHVDCAHYGGSDNFLGFKEESAAYSEDLKTSALILKERLPDIRTLAYVLHSEKAGHDERFIFQEVAV